MKQLLLTVVTVILTTSAFAQQSDRDRGIDLYRDGKFTEAVAALEKSVAAIPNDRHAWIYLGGAYFHTDEKAKAEEAFKKSNVPDSVKPQTFERTVNITVKPRPNFGRPARGTVKPGSVRVAVEFRADGTIGFIYPFGSADPKIIEPSVEAARGMKFEPAIKNGKPVTTINLLQYSFSIY